MPTHCQTADQPDTKVGPHQVVSVLAHSGEKLKLGIGGVRAKAVHPGQFQAGHYTVTKSVPQRHCSIQNASRPRHTPARSRHSMRSSWRWWQRRRGDSRTDWGTRTGGCPRCRQQPELACGMPPQTPMQKRLLQAQRCYHTMSHETYTEQAVMPIGPNQTDFGKNHHADDGRNHQSVQQWKKRETE